METSISLGPPIDLAEEPSFRLGAVVVEPSLRQILVRGERQTLEPRIMQVLVVLAQANGAVVSRDTLLERCWEGRIVSEAAINRVISRLRQLAADSGDEGFKIETITKVGYRLSDGSAADAGLSQSPGLRISPAPTVPVAPPQTASRQVPRRAMIGGGVAMTAAVAGFGWWQATSAVRQRQEKTAALIELGRRSSLLEGTPDASRQAVAYLREATQIDPGSAEAWGALALALTDLRRTTGAPPELTAWAERCRSAARRALEIDSGNADALVALALVPPNIHNWQARLTTLRGLLQRFPDHVRLRHAYAFTLAMIGRHSDAVPELRRIKQEAPLFGLGRQLLVLSLWTAGRTEEADQEIAASFRIWPSTFWIWLTRFNLLALSGRASEALALAASPERPTFPWPAEISLASAEALHSRDPAAVARAVQMHIDAAGTGRYPFFSSTLYLSALGALPAAFAVSRDHLLALPSPYSNPPTGQLFMPPAAAMWQDSRFEPLLKAIGLEGFWAATGTIPDFRQRR